MFGYVRSVLNNVLEYIFPFLYNKKGTLLFLGLDNAGKSCLLLRLKENRMGQPAPTASETLHLGKLTLTTYDLGGHKQVRRMWRDYFPAADGIVFIVDASARKRFPVAKEELHGILNEPMVANVPIVVLANKIDIPEAASPEEIVCAFDLYESLTGKDVTTVASLQGRRPLEVYPCSVLHSQGYGDALRWLAEFF